MDRRDFIRGASVAAAAAASGVRANAAAAAGAAPSVRARQGVLEGFEEDGVAKFFGVPFAKPPVGDLRWRAPQPPAAWSGTRPAKTFAPAAMQLPINPSFRTSGMSEDCLYLNVWTTSLSKTAKQPVMVWFHGGGNIRGSASEAFTDGSNLAKLGVTVVAPNYRLGAFGFLNDEEMGANFAVLDHVAALKWVQENIEAFGGDPSRVLIFGYSAGALAVRNLLECPQARGLFQRAVMQSAAGELPVSTEHWSSARSREATHKLFEALGTTDRAALRAIPAERVNAVSRQFSNVPVVEGGFRTPMNLVWVQVPDGKVVMGDSFPAWGRDVPAMLSCNKNEARWGMDVTKPYEPSVLDVMTRKLAGPKADEAARLLEAGGGTVLEKLDRLYTTINWTEQAYASLRRFDRDGRRLYYYEFERLSPGRKASNRLVSHGTDVYYIFGNLIEEGAYEDLDRQVSREIQHAYIEFARTGVPKRLDGAAWPRFQAQSQQYTRVGDTVAFAPYRPDPLLTTIYSLRGSAPA
jgi:para-nitrobenzyl esterase